MRLTQAAGALLVALAVTACVDQQPTRVDDLGPTAISADKGGKKPEKAQSRAQLLTEMDVAGTLSGGGDFEGHLTVTELSYDETAETLLMDGVLTWVSDGQLLAQVLDDVPVDLSRRSGASTLSHQGPNEPGVCDILYLTIPGGIFLDVLGLTVDLAPIELDIDALRGANRLLGNLLCAVTGLLDGGGLGGLLNLLDRINDILDDLLGSIGELLDNLPVTGTLPGGGTFEGLLDITEFGLEDGQLTISGLLTGTVTQGGVTRSVTQAFTSIAVDLSEILGGASILSHQGPNEPGVCDILYLTIPGGIFLDVLGLTVDLAPIELDIDAVSGANRLLGNLLCALTGLLGLLTDLPALIGQISDLIDLINEIIDLSDRL